MRIRKPQITRYSKDKEGNRLYKAVDMGFSDSHWAKIKSQAIFDAMIRIIPLAWRIIKIDYNQETAFTKSLERAYKKLDSKPRYLLIRTQSEGDDQIHSWFFLHNPLEKAGELDKLLAPNRLIRSARELKSIITELFDVKIHPYQFEGKKGKRFSISKALRPDLIVSRMETLIGMARKQESHSLVDGIKQTTDFETRLAKYIKADNPLIYRLKLKSIFIALATLEKKKGIITRDEVIKVMQKLLEGRDWETEGFYEGLPKHGIERDKKEGGFTVYEGKHGALSVRIGGKAKSEWDLENMIEAGSEEEYIE